MAVDKVPVLKRCRSLGLDPVFLGVDKKSNRQARNATDYSFAKSRKPSSSTVYWRSRSVTTTRRQRDFRDRPVRI